ncbi:DUF1833 family protein [Methylobacterium sp. Leaf85]|uniref:DUF1833 family protein n=1 Tax=Methylobacterium sp. Leaf85 TaxID=1736241 RepID=UPI0006F3404C|nr:DUF1833 family protein [Methylobacterium sp. Leaf85]KQO53065.1 hypothetical protein ASF08_19260 [Methylobacterium sp. Leaf85]
MRTLSRAFKAELLVENSGLTEVGLMTITHPDLDEPIRASSHPGDLISVDPLVYALKSRGETYLYIDFAFTFPDDEEGKTEAIQIVLESINRETVDLLRSTIEPAIVTVEIVSLDTPDLVEIQWPEFDLVLADGELSQITLGLSLDAQGEEPFPCDSFTPASHGGLF